MLGEKAKLLCSFGGEFISQQGKAYYVGGKTRLVSIERSASFRSLLTKMSELCGADPSVVDVKFQLPEGGLDNRLISMETDDDVRNMMEEFDNNRKIPIFLFTDKILNNDDEEEEEEDDDETVDVDPGPALERAGTAPTENIREAAITGLDEEPFDIQNVPSISIASREDPRNSAIGPSITGEIFRRDSQSLVVGQEYDDVQTFRIALTSAAIAANFKLHMIRSDQRRVTARCAFEGCTWRVHASKLPQVSTFRIRTLTTEHICVRSDDAGHGQATAKWIANCIRDKLRQNQNYKPREIMNDIHREYGVLITYKRAFLGREKALEDLRTEFGRDVEPVENTYEAIEEINHVEIPAWGEIHDPPRKKRVYRPRHFMEVRPLHCTRCNQIGHNRRTCTFPELMGG